MTSWSMRLWDFLSKALPSPIHKGVYWKLHSDWNVLQCDRCFSGRE